LNCNSGVNRPIPTLTSNKSFSLGFALPSITIFDTTTPFAYVAGMAKKPVKTSIPVASRQKPSVLLHTRIICCRDNLVQLAKKLA